MATVYTTDLIPDMTSDSAPSGTASASSILSIYNPYRAMDDSGTSYWRATSGTNEWIAYEFTSSKTITKYTMTTYSTSTTEMPNTWTFEGYNGATWDTLDSQSGITWTTSEKKEYTFTNSTSYTKYRINISTINGGSVVRIAEIEMMEGYDNSDTTDTFTEYTGTDEFGSKTTYQDWNDGNDYFASNFIERDDGKILIGYSKYSTGTHYVSWIDDEAGLGTDDITTNETSFGSGFDTGTYEGYSEVYVKSMVQFFKTSTGKIIAFTYNPGLNRDASGAGTAGTATTVRFHTSTNGLGTDFGSGTIIYTSDDNDTHQAGDQTGGFHAQRKMLHPCQEIDGTLFIKFGGANVYRSGTFNGYWHGTENVLYSTDDGVTWNWSEVWRPLNLSGDMSTTIINGASGMFKAGTLYLMPINLDFSVSYYKTQWYYADESDLSNWYVFGQTAENIHTRAVWRGSDGYIYWYFHDRIAAAQYVYRRDANTALDDSDAYSVGAGNSWPEQYSSSTTFDNPNTLDFWFESPSGQNIIIDKTTDLLAFYTTARTAVAGITAGGIATTTATIFICDYQGTVSAETGTVEGSITVAAHGLNTDDFIVNTTQNNTSRRILSTTTDTMTVVSVSGQTVSDIVRTYAFTDHTDLLKDQSLTVNKKIQEDTEARFTLICDPTYVPRAGQYVKINTNSQHVFTGFLRSVNRRLPQNGIDTKIFCDCECITLNAIPPRRTITIAYDVDTTAGTIVESMVNDFLVAEGVTSGTIDAGVNLFEDKYNDALSISDLLDDLADMSGFQWEINKDWELNFLQDKTTISTYSATISDLTTSTFSDFRNVTINETIDNYNNKAFYVGNTDYYGDIIVVSQETTASILEVQDYAAGTGVYGAVVRDSNMREHEFFTATAGTTVGTIVSSGIDVEVDVGDLVFNRTKYQRMNVTSVTTDTLTVDSTIVNEQDDIIVTYQDINDVVDNHLKRDDQISRRLEFDSFTTDFEAGQKLEVVLSKLSATTTETYVIDEVSIQDRGANYFVAHVVADKRNPDNFSTQRTPNYKDYYRQF